MRRLSALTSVFILSCATTQTAAPVAPPPAAVVAAPPVTTPDAPFRATQPPPLAAEPPFSPPVAQVSKLSDGAKLLVVENHALPVVAVEIVVLSGMDVEPLAKHGLAGFTASMLLEGTKGQSAIDLAIARERLAAQISVTAGYETTTLHLNALKETLPESLALLGDVLLNPAWRASDIERVRGLTLTALEQKKGNPGALARDAFGHIVWGDKHPWGLPSGGTPATIRAITAADLKRFHDRWYVPNNAIVSVSGDVTADEIRGLLDQTFAKWKPRPVPARRAARFPATSPRSIVTADVPTASQSQVLVGWRGPKATDADALPLLVANNVLGGLFTSRLNLNLREQKAFSYGVKSRLSFYRDTGTLVAAGGIVAQHTAEAVAEFEKELDRLRSGDLGDEEISRAKEALIRGLPSQLETNDAVAAAMANLVVLGLPPDYYATLPGRVAAVQKPQVLAAIRKVVQPDRWPIVVVGPTAQNEAALKALGLGDVRPTPVVE